MKAFDLEAAKAGVPLITRSGKRARLICWDRVDTKYEGHLVVLVCNEKKTWERVVQYNIEGHTIVSWDKDLDLFLDDGRK